MTYCDTLPIGTLVRLKCDRKRIGLVMKGGDWSGRVEYYDHWGRIVALRREVSICRDQSLASEFVPMRLYLPYGKWTCKNGDEVLFSRDYRPLWAKAIDGTVTAIDPDTWVEYSKQEWFFNDTTVPLYNKKTYETCRAILKQWGVENQRPKLLGLLPQVIATGDTRILKVCTGTKTFPKYAA